MSNLDFSQGFTKSGQLVSQYGGFEPTYDGNKNKRIKRLIWVKHDMFI
jgi:hypothetical protein